VDEREEKQMAGLVKAKWELSEHALALTSVLQTGESKPGTQLAFSELDKGFQEVAEGDGDVVSFGEASHGVRATGLHSCAAICFVNTRRKDGPMGYVYHANTGTISYGKFGEIIKAIGARPSDEYEGVYVAYAHRGPTDKGHDSSVKELQGWLEKGKLVQITDLFFNQFGMNGHFQIGY
jgi:hypothetical protein